jgi:hypothetical protein
VWFLFEVGWICQFAKKSAKIQLTFNKDPELTAFQKPIL